VLHPDRSGEKKKEDSLERRGLAIGDKRRINPSSHLVDPWA